MTNAEKFEEIFQKSPATYASPLSCSGTFCNQCNYYRAGGCKAYEWWFQEYKPKS